MFQSTLTVLSRRHIYSCLLAFLVCSRVILASPLQFSDVTDEEEEVSSSRSSSTSATDRPETAADVDLQPAADASVTPTSVQHLTCPSPCDCFNYHETVDCSRRDMVELPASLPHVVRRLYLEGNQIEELGDDGRLSVAVNLSVLIVEDNRLTELNVDALCRLTHLQELDASGNQIREFITVGRCGAKMVALKELNLSHNRLTSVPSNLSSIAPNLEILLLSHNEITSAMFDASYSSMSLLRHVDLAHNDIRRLLAADLDPLRVGPGRPAVEYLNLADCGLVYVEPTAFDGLDNLTSLTLSRCLVNRSTLVRSFSGASFHDGLLRLDVSETFIGNLTVDMIGSFVNLVGLFASYCDLQSVDAELFQRVSDLETFYVDGGRLERLDGLDALTKLRRLSAHMNQLSELESIAALESLETVDLSYNKFRRLPVNWIGGPDIQLLNLSHNEITVIERGAISLTSAIATLDLSHNLLAVFPDLGSLKLSRLDVSHNGMSAISRGAFDSLHESLNELDLSYNNFRQFDDDVFVDFRLLQYLCLAHNRLGEAFSAGKQKLGRLFDSLQLLQVLDLSYNGIAVIQPPDLLSSLHHLNTLYVEGNLIRDLSDASIASTRVLAKLVVAGNQLRAPDVDLLSRLEYLEEIDFGNNPFECTCTLSPFITWTNSTTVTVLGYEDINRYQCEFPPSARGQSIFGRGSWRGGHPQDCGPPGPTSRGGHHGGDRFQAEDDDDEDQLPPSGRTSVIYTLAALACLTGGAATITGGALICRYGQLCRRVKGLRYRWQIRYREVSAVETASDPKN